MAQDEVCRYIYTQASQHTLDRVFIRKTFYSTQVLITKKCMGCFIGFLACLFAGFTYFGRRCPAVSPLLSRQISSELFDMVDGCDPCDNFVTRYQKNNCQSKVYNKTNKQTNKESNDKHLRTLAISWSKVFKGIVH